MTSFTSIRLKGWRQFGEIDIDLSKQVSILTGANGSGKTSILNILSRHFGWEAGFVSTPYWSKTKLRELWSDVRRLFDSSIDEKARQEVGTIIYENGSKCSLFSQHVHQSAKYNLKYEGQEPVTGLHIPSHRPPVIYHRIDQIPTRPVSAQQLYQNYTHLLQQVHGSEGATRNPTIAQKEALVALALLGYGSKAVKENPTYIKLFEDFEAILSKLLPKELGFEKLEIRTPEVVLLTKSGEFVLDAMSGGINALFSMAWQVHMFGATEPSCTITIDEPENHLHPSMQRSLLPNLAAAFPNYRFIVATHSPFIVSSFRDSSVYGLSFNEKNKVVSRKLSIKDLSGTPNVILREFLDVPSTLPIWVEEEISALISEMENDDPRAKAKLIMERLKQLGLADAISNFWTDETN